MRQNMYKNRQEYFVNLLDSKENIKDYERHVRKMQEPTQRHSLFPRMEQFEHW